MDIFGDLPAWAVVLLSLLLAAVLIVLNIGWLLQARGMLEEYSRRRQERERRRHDPESREPRDLDR